MGRGHDSEKERKQVESKLSGFALSPIRSAEGYRSLL